MNTMSASSISPDRTNLRLCSFTRQAAMRLMRVVVSAPIPG
jgi:hypothetical protein